MRCNNGFYKCLTYFYYICTGVLPVCYVCGPHARSACESQKRTGVRAPGTGVSTAADRSYQPPLPMAAHPGIHCGYQGAFSLSLTQWSPDQVPGGFRQKQPWRAIPHSANAVVQGNHSAGSLLTPVSKLQPCGRSVCILAPSSRCTTPSSHNF